VIDGQEAQVHQLGIDRRGLLRTLLFGAAAGAGSTVVPAIGSVRATAESGSRTLLVYFSRPGENYYYGDRIDLETGNTEVLANLIRDCITCNVYRIEASEPYSANYDATVARNVSEQESNARPGIANLIESIEDYDTILLGSPIWNVRPPRIMLTFAEAFDFTGKTVYPFTTHAMSGLGRAISDYTASCPGAAIGDGLAVLGEEVIDDPSAAATHVETWLAEIDLPGDTRTTQSPRHIPSSIAMRHE